MVTQQRAARKRPSAKKMPLQKAAATKKVARETMKRAGEYNQKEGEAWLILKSILMPPQFSENGLH
jgi:hypothetical protein